MVAPETVSIELFLDLIAPQQPIHIAVVDGISFRSVPGAVLAGEGVVIAPLTGYLDLGDVSYER